jgi:MFS family permease
MTATSQVPGRRSRPARLAAAWRAGPLGLPGFRLLTFGQLAAVHVSSLAAVAPLAALLGAFSALFMPASMAIMPSLLDSSRLTSANAVYTSVVQAGSVLGPLLGGILVATTGPATAFGVDAGSYLVSAVTLAFIATARQTQAAAAALPEETAPGSTWALLRRSRLLQTILVVAVVANFALLGTSEVALPALAHARFGAGGYGAVLACVAVAPVFPITGALLALSMIYGLTQREFRDFGTEAGETLSA